MKKSKNQDTPNHIWGMYLINLPIMLFFGLNGLQSSLEITIHTLFIGFVLNVTAATLMYFFQKK